MHYVGPDIAGIKPLREVIARIVEKPHALHLVKHIVAAGQNYRSVYRFDTWTKWQQIPALYASVRQENADIPKMEAWEKIRIPSSYIRAHIIKHFAELKEGYDPAHIAKGKKILGYKTYSEWIAQKSYGSPRVNRSSFFMVERMIQRLLREDGSFRIPGIGTLVVDKSRKDPVYLKTFPSFRAKLNGKKYARRPVVEVS